MTSEAQDIQAPLVFQCTQCKTIIGDSFAWVGAFEELNGIVLSSKSKVILDLWSEGQRFITLPRARIKNDAKCGECQQLLGRLYNATTSKWDLLRNCLLLQVDKILTYELGRTNSPPSKDDAHLTSAVLEYHSARSLSTSVTQMKQVLVALNERLTQVEAVVGDKLK
ncbi:Protein Mis18-alpha [Dispira parvispora]|uniref:Protein Mis18-alpha n=1 Tax=Dispira parvispora TaxID=1520584 RepID=A0A9W8ART9_9FUNG|nr:Protein Mis18-alpha [Dispira parvispora]